ncbi:MAG: hypothetical protein EP298_11070 [Gammaproteobacteria bacterium]|nr:MAG: hypothetical protein EP298_11070 [Gammaproteobacteria bacterium]
MKNSPTLYELFNEILNNMKYLFIKTKENSIYIDKNDIDKLNILTIEIINPFLEKLSTPQFTDNSILNNIITNYQDTIENNIKTLFKNETTKNNFNTISIDNIINFEIILKCLFGINKLSLLSKALVNFKEIKLSNVKLAEKQTRILNSLIAHFKLNIDTKTITDNLTTLSKIQKLNDQKTLEIATNNALISLCKAKINNQNDIVNQLILETADLFLNIMKPTIKYFRKNSKIKTIFNSIFSDFCYFNDTGGVEILIKSHDINDFILNTHASCIKSYSDSKNKNIPTFFDEFIKIINHKFNLKLPYNTIIQNKSIDINHTDYSTLKLNELLTKNAYLKNEIELNNYEISKITLHDTYQSHSLTN